MSTVPIIDDPQTLNVLRIAFTARGYQVVTEAAGHAALRTASQAKPQVILRSVELSDMVWREGAEVRLTPTEWSVLGILIRHEGYLVSQRELLRTVWGRSTIPTPTI